MVYDSEIADSNPFRGMDVRIFALLMLSCGLEVNVAMSQTLPGIKNPPVGCYMSDAKFETILSHWFLPF